MNVNKLLILALIFPLFCFSQNQKEDAYFIISKDHKEYTLGSHKNTSNFESFSLYDKIEYNKRQERIKKDKDDGRPNYDNNKRLPNTLTFRVKSKKKEVITHCDIHKLKLNVVDYNWLIYNSWKENNPNILFKDLYFLLKIEKDKYLKYKVERTVIAY
ncbi:hypothetical protein [Lutibacter sp.]|uniref:hypothetical protein n=1 Tax=Lutibacter sp. TaxID=1925666 RepID=UPI00349FD1FF